MLNSIKKIFEDWTNQYERDEYDLTLHEWIKSLIDRIDYLEDQHVWIRSELKRLSDENIGTTNSLYELENKIDSALNKEDTLKNFTLGDS
jgi:uncharacterized coiled-coil DUF342 family protein